MIEPNPKADLLRYLQEARDALVWKLDGLSEYDIRRPLTSTGTTLVGLVKQRRGHERLLLRPGGGRNAPGDDRRTAAEGAREALQVAEDLPGRSTARTMIA